MRLIDADKLIKDRVENDPVRIAVECEPTAFDKEKVIERLRGERDNQLKNWEGNLFWNDNRREDGIINGLSIAIEAVEKGGIE